MKNAMSSIKISEVRSKLNRLDKLLKPGEALQINKRGKAYAIIELVEDADPYEKVLNAIESLPEPEEKLRTVAENYKANLCFLPQTHTDGHRQGPFG